MSTLRSLFRATGRLYRRLFRRRIDERTQHIMDVLGTLPALHHVSTGSLHTMAEAVHQRTYRRGEAMYYEGDPGLGLYVLAEGTVRLSMETEPGRPCDLCQVSAPNLFGTLSILGDFPRLETATPLTEARVLGFFRPDLKNIVKRHPKAGAELTAAFARDVAAHHVELIHLMAEQHGREMVLQLHTEARKHVAQR